LILRRKLAAVLGLLAASATLAAPAAANTTDMEMKGSHETLPGGGDRFRFVVTNNGPDDLNLANNEKFQLVAGIYPYTAQLDAKVGLSPDCPRSNAYSLLTLTCAFMGLGAGESKTWTLTLENGSGAQRVSAGINTYVDNDPEIKDESYEFSFDTAPQPKKPSKHGCRQGTEAGESLAGTPRADCIDAGGGEDRVDGKGGDDRVSGGPGIDAVIGGGGRDVILGGSGDDVLADGIGRNQYAAGPGDDIVFARQSIGERVDCGPGRDAAVVDHKDTVIGCESVTYESHVTDPLNPPSRQLAGFPGLDSDEYTIRSHLPKSLDLIVSIEGTHKVEAYLESHALGKTALQAVAVGFACSKLPKHPAVQIVCNASLGYLAGKLAQVFGDASREGSCVKLTFGWGIDQLGLLVSPKPKVKSFAPYNGDFCRNLY
jgi:hemolysin type calcium-binding protein